MPNSQSVLIVALSVALLSPANASGAGESLGGDSASIRVAEPGQGVGPAPSVLTTFQQDAVVRGWVVMRTVARRRR